MEAFLERERRKKTETKHMRENRGKREESFLVAAMAVFVNHFTLLK